MASKLGPLLYALVVGGLLIVEDDLFSNTAEASRYLVKGKPAYIGTRGELIATNWTRELNAAATIRAGEQPEIFDFHAMAQDELALFFRGLYPGAVAEVHVGHIDVRQGAESIGVSVNVVRRDVARLN